MRVFKGSSACLVACLSLLALSACVDDQFAPQEWQPQFAKPSCATAASPGQQKKCEPPKPPEGEHHLPALSGDQALSPLRLDHSRPGWLLATDARVSWVVRIDPSTLQPYEGFRARGRPLGVTVLGTSIFLGNADRGTVDVHRTDGGGFTSSFGPGAVQYPADLAADADAGLIFALDGGRKEVRVFTPSGDLVNVISGPGAGEGQLLNPVAIGLDPVRQWVLVSDYGSADGGDAYLKVFDYAGGLVHEVSGAGRCGMLGCSGGFSRPQGATVDAYGRIFLPDALLAQIIVIEPEGWSITHTLGDRNYLRVPTDVAFGEFGDLFVASNRGGAVEVFRGAGEPS